MSTQATSTAKLDRDAIYELGRQHALSGRPLEEGLEEFFLLTGADRNESYAVLATLLERLEARAAAKAEIAE